MRAGVLSTDADIIDELRWRTRWRGSSTSVAEQMGISRSHLLGIINGNARLGEDARQRILEGIRRDELDLADRIEAEMGIEWPIRKRGE